MLTFYGAYLIRCWQRDEEICRIEIVHVQTGERALVHSPNAALAWIGSHRPGRHMDTGEEGK